RRSTLRANLLTRQIPSPGAGRSWPVRTPYFANCPSDTLLSLPRLLPEIPDEIDRDGRQREIEATNNCGGGTERQHLSLRLLWPVNSAFHRQRPKIEKKPKLKTLRRPESVAPSRGDPNGRLRPDPGGSRLAGWPKAHFCRSDH